MARMTKRTTSKGQRELEPYWNNPNVKSVQYELKFGRETIVPGTLIHIKNDRSVYRFAKLVVYVDPETGDQREWIDCMNVTLGSFYSFYVSRIRGLVHKRSRAKKLNDK